MQGMIVLGIETSCDETAAAVVAADRRILSDIVLSQIEEHRPYRGVVPEIAARSHLDHIDRLIAQALEDAQCGWTDLHGIAATAGPGLIGGVLVGLTTAKAIALVRDLPLIAVNHLEGHALTARLTDGIDFPYLLLLVSGGHCQLVAVQGVGRYRHYGGTVDDAVGEAFDKVARTFGFGFPGGPEIERAAREGHPGHFRLPRPMLASTDHPGDPAYFDFSFSGLKTAAALLAADLTTAGGSARLEQARPDLAAEFQEAVLDVLVAKTRRAVEYTGCTRVVLGGGVSRNGRLRERLASEMAGLADVHAPPPRLATDNAAMVACVARHRLLAGKRADPSLNADPAYPFPGLVPNILQGTTCIRN